MRYIRSQKWPVSMAVARALALLGLSAAAQAADVLPTGDLLIQKDGAAPVVFTAQQIAALPQHTIATATPWTDGVKQFQGPLVAEVLKAAGVTLTTQMTVQAQALNGYVIDVPAADFLRWPVIVAYTMDGKALSRRDKGPLWVVYPRDSSKELQDAKYDHRWAWQLSQLLVSDAP